jgi:beta-galactosidase
LRLQGGLEQLHYYGRGPEENYADRQFGYPLGRYDSTVDDEYVPYVTPQEHGNHTDVRWLALTDARSAAVPADEPAAVLRQPFPRPPIFTLPDTRSI